MTKQKNDIRRWLHEYSIPLIAGVLAALALANWAPDFYDTIVWGSIADLFHSSNEHGHHGHGWQHFLSMHFLVNDLFMVVFFGVAAKEITEACLPKGALNPISKAVNPLFATVGGILFPVGVFLVLNSLMGTSEWAVGWGIPTATDIALAWLVARMIFGAGHPAICFLLLLAVADDAIGLGIIAIAYPDPHHPTEWLNAMWILPGMAIAYGLRRMQVHSWLAYVFAGGAFSWWGLYSAHLHPALALVFIVPFIPGPNSDLGLYAEKYQRRQRRQRKRQIFAFIHESAEHASQSPLENFEHDLRLFVDCGLFFFALANAGVPVAELSSLTWIILSALIFGKTFGITLFSWAATLIGFPLPKGMDLRHLVVTGSIAGIGLTVALFVSGQAYADIGTQNAAKMGALMSAGAAAVSVALAVAFRLTTLRLPSLQSLEQFVTQLTARYSRSAN